MPNNDLGAEKKEIFFPFYINQGRLLDLFAILNDGYFEYSEISTSVNVSDDKKEKIKSTHNGFKILEIGGCEATRTNSTVKKIQTLTSILSNVKETLEDKGYLLDIDKVSAGGFICVPVNLRINSVKTLLEEVSELLKLIGAIDNLNNDVSKDKRDIQSYESMLKNIKTLFGGDEVIYETDSFAIIGNIIENNLYQSVKSDLIGIDLKCLAQVKRVFPSGTELMRNTIFSNIKNHKTKNQLIEKINTINNQEIYDFNVSAVSSIEGKPVYQVEIIALYQ